MPEECGVKGCPSYQYVGIVLSSHGCDDSEVREVTPAGCRVVAKDDLTLVEVVS